MVALITTIIIAIIILLFCSKMFLVLYWRFLLILMLSFLYVSQCKVLEDSTVQDGLDYNPGPALGTPMRNRKSTGPP